jgi:general secretion pathway protein G
VIALNQTVFAMPRAALQQRSVISTGAAEPRSGETCFSVHAWMPRVWLLRLSSAASQPSITNPEAGLTLVELIIVVAILSILATAAFPIARFQVRREKERELRRDLWEMRAAIDRYKDACDKGAFQAKADSICYPPDLQTLVDGVDVQGKKVRFLRRIPTDPMTGNTEWGLRSNQDDPDSDSFGGQNVFDVHSKSQGTALDGSKYSTW